MEDLAASIETVEHSVLADQQKLFELRNKFAARDDLDDLDTLNREITELIQQLKIHRNYIIELRATLRSTVCKFLSNALGEDAAGILLAVYLSYSDDEYDRYVRLYRALGLHSVAAHADETVIDFTDDDHELTDVDVNVEVENHPQTEAESLSIHADAQPSNELEISADVDGQDVSHESDSNVQDEDQSQTDPAMEVLLSDTVDEQTSKADVIVGASRRIDPAKRGGRPRGQKALPELSIQDVESREDVPARKDRPRVQIEARRFGMEWELFIVASAGSRSSDDHIEICQDDVLLERDDSGSNSWKLASLSDFDVAVDDGEPIQYRMPWIDVDILAFRLRNDSTARAVTSIGASQYALLVPQGWKSVSDDIEFMASHDCTIAGYKFIFIDLQSEPECIEFKRTGGTTRLELKRTLGFRCEGAHVDDVNPIAPPIFGPELPTLVADRPEAWDEIAQIVLVEEGDAIGRARRRAMFQPRRGSAIQMMPALTEWKGGWFTARLYDVFSNLVETVSFRYIFGFKLSNHGKGGLPAFGVQVNASYSMTWMFANMLQITCDSLTDDVIKKTLSGLSVRLNASDPFLDVIEWRIRGISDVTIDMQLRIRADRTWWAIGKSGVAPSKWSCESLSLNRAHFRAGAGDVLWLKTVPDRSLYVGFERENARVVCSDDSTGLAELPLRVLGMESVIAVNNDEAVLRLWSTDDETEIARVSAALQDADFQDSDDGESVVTLTQNSPTSDKKTRSLEGDDEPITTVVSTELVDYSDLFRYVEDSAYQWCVVKCRAKREEQTVAQLRDLLRRDNLDHDVPVVVFPVRRVKKQKSYTDRTKYEIFVEPAVAHEYIFVLKKPDVSLFKYLSWMLAEELIGEFDPEWLNSIIQYKRQAQDSGQAQITIRSRVILTDGPMKGMVGEVIEINNSRGTLKLGIDLFDRTIRTEVDRSLVVLAQP